MFGKAEEGVSEFDFGEVFAGEADFSAKVSERR